MSINELDRKIDSTLSGSKIALDETSGSYLDRMESFLSKHDNQSIEQILSTRDNDDDYDVDIEWKIPQKETCDVGENTVHKCHFFLNIGVKLFLGVQSFGLTNYFGVKKLFWRK